MNETALRREVTVPNPNRDIERRVHPRVAGTTNASLFWRGAGGQVLRTRASTRDISPRGLYLYAEQLLDRDTPVEFDLVFPTEMTAAEPVRLHGEGKVIRNEALGKRFGLVVSIASHALAPLSREELAFPEAERRAQARVQSPSPLYADYPGLESVIRDLSTAGAFVEDERPLPVGRRFTLRLRGPSLSSALEVCAVVRRVEPQVGMAVEFVSMSEEALKALRMLVGGQPGVSPTLNSPETGVAS